MDKLMNYLHKCRVYTQSPFTSKEDRKYWEQEIDKTLKELETIQ